MKDCTMNEQEKIASYIATCKCCMLAQTMKNCPLCLFNIGLAEPVELVEPISLPVQMPITMFAVSG